MNFCNPNALFSQKQMLHIYHHIPMDTDLFICIREFVNVCLCEWVRACVCASLWMAVSLHLWPFVHMSVSGCMHKATFGYVPVSVVLVISYVWHFLFVDVCILFLHVCVPVCTWVSVCMHLCQWVHLLGTHRCPWEHCSWCVWDLFLGVLLCLCLSCGCTFFSWYKYTGTPALMSVSWWVSVCASA